MNKQEAIEKIKRRTEYFKVEKEYNRGFRDGLNNSIPVIREIDAPEKPVVPRFVADMIVERKKQGCSLVGTLVNLGAFGDAQRWIRKGDNGDTFAKAWLFGYEIEKQKLYTAKLKLTNEYLSYRPRFNAILHCIVPETTAKEIKLYHFTEDDLVKYHVWGNDTYEVTEVEE